MSADAQRSASRVSGGARTSAPEYASPGAGLAVWLVRMLGLGLLALIAVWGRDYPGGALLAGALLCVYAALLWHRPEIWLFVVPAVLPVVDFAPWTGWVYVDELDFVLAVTVIVVAWRLPRAEKASLTPGVGVLLAVLSMTWFLSLLLGVLPLESFHNSVLGGYYTKYNALRVAKGFFWVVLLWPLARRTVGRDLVNLERWFFPGVLAGVVALGLVVLWERAAFVGLADFSSPHRITALFSSMHVGGGAIDGYLALSVPFSWWLISRFDSPARSLLGLGIFALGAYCIIVTFSRGLYAGFVASLLILAFTQFGSAARERSLGFSRFFLGAILLAVLAALFARVFAHGGYRALGAALFTLAAGYVLGSRPLPLKHAFGAMLAGVLLISVSWTLARMMDKGAYLAFGLSALVALAGAALQFTGRTRATANPLLAVGFVWCLLNCVLVAQHWGGASARAASMAASFALLAALLANLLSKQAIWTEGVRSGATAAILAMIFLAGMPIVGRSYFIGQRVSTGSSDMDRRLQHWREVWQLQRSDVLSQLFGLGFGRFPAAYYAHNPHGTRPGAVTYPTEAGNTYARLVGPDNDHGTPIYLGQHASITPNQAYQINLRARSSGEKPAKLSLGFCRVVVLFTDACVWTAVEVAPGAWQGYSQVLASAGMGRREWFGRVPVRMILVNAMSNAAIDVDEVILSTGVQSEAFSAGDQAGNLLRNGDFARAPDYWFYSVNDFWPWHIENTWLLVLLETGWIGLLCFLGALGFTFMRLLGRTGHAPPHRAVWLAALGGFCIVATFNSQFEFPRVTLMFFLVLLLALMRAQTQPLVDAIVQRSRASARQSKQSAFDRVPED